MLIIVGVCHQTAKLKKWHTYKIIRIEQVLPICVRLQPLKMTIIIKWCMIPLQIHN